MAASHTGGMTGCRVVVDGVHDLVTSSAGASVPPLDAAVRFRDRPTWHLQALRDNHCFGRCSVWTDDTPRLNGHRVGLIGHYACADAAAGAALLATAADLIRRAGLRVAVGPMDGSTWRAYRFVADAGTEPPFFLEPTDAPAARQQFADAGFTPLAEYFSSLNDDLTVQDRRTAAGLARFAADGTRIRTIDLNRFDEELLAVHALSTEAFANNFLYTPISAADFLDLYRPLRSLIRPDLVLLAERRSELVGFLFGLPDVLEDKTGRPTRTAIAKSMAVRPGRAEAGLGSLLMDQFQQAARHAGFTRVIHALMHADNRSIKLSGRYARPIRRYTLLHKALPS